MSSSSNRTQRSINVDEDALARFTEIYPIHGAFTWFVNECLKHFVTAHDIHPSDLVATAVSEALSSKD